MQNDETTETEAFLRMFDKFFDCVNVRTLSEGIKKKKPNLMPYRSSSDERLKVCFFVCLSFIFLWWLKEEFLDYFVEWETSVNERMDGKFTKAEKAKMMLSRETTSGLKVTGNICSQT